MTETTVRAHVAEHPRLIGVLFFSLLLLSQTQPAAACAGVANFGP